MIQKYSIQPAEVDEYTNSPHFSIDTSTMDLFNNSHVAIHEDKGKRCASEPLLLLFEKCHV